MQIILVMLNNYQSYILDNIDNLLKFNNTSITVITDSKFRTIFLAKSPDLNIINVEDILPNYVNDMKDTSNTFRNGFWKLATYRFYALHAYMEKYNSTNIVHIENDVLVYKNLDEIIFHDTNKILLTMDSEKRCIPGFMFIPNPSILKICLHNFRPGLNDMENWSLCFHHLKQLTDTLPIFLNDKSTPCKEYTTQNFQHYNAIFDAAAIGQFLGGVDPRNAEGNTVGFMNETCVFNYTVYKFTWSKNKDNLCVPHIIINDIEYPIINLHIHSKNLKTFISI